MLPLLALSWAPAQTCVRQCASLEGGSLLYSVSSITPSSQGIHTPAVPAKSQIWCLIPIFSALSPAQTRKSIYYFKKWQKRLIRIWPLNLSSGKSPRDKLKRSSLLPTSSPPLSLALWEWLRRWWNLGAIWLGKNTLTAKLVWQESGVEGSKPGMNYGYWVRLGQVPAVLRSAGMWTRRKMLLILRPPLNALGMGRQPACD